MAKFFISIFFVTNTFITISAQDLTTSFRYIDSLITADQFEKADWLLDSIQRIPYIARHEWYRVELDILKGDLCLGKNNYIESIKHYRSILTKAHPADTASALKFAKALNDLGIAYYHTSKPDSAKNVHHRSIEIYRSYGDQQGLAYNYNNLAIIAKDLKEIDKALNYYQKSSDAARSINDSLGFGFIALNLGVLCYDNKREIEAIEYFYEALEIFTALGKDTRANSVKTRLGKAYLRLNVFNSARSILNQAREYFTIHKEYWHLSHVYIYLSDMFIAQNQPDSAIYFLNSALECSGQMNDKTVSGQIYYRFGKVFEIKEDLDSAHYYFERSLNGFAGTHLDGEMISRLALAKLLLARGEFERAIRESEKVRAMANGNLGSRHEEVAYTILYEANKALGNNLKAFRNLEALQSVKDSLFNKEKALEVARIEYGNYLETREAEQKAEREKLKLAYQQDLNEQRWVKRFAIACFLSLVIILSCWYRSHRLKKRDNAYLARKNSIIEAANNELRALREKDRINQLREKALMNKSIATKERELAAIVMVNHEKNTILCNIDQRLAEMIEMVEDDTKIGLKELKRLVSSNLNLGESWNSFIHQFVTVHPNFFESLKKLNPDLTLHDLKLCAYLKIGMDNKNIAQVTYVAPDSVKKSITRLRKKLKLNQQQNIRHFVMHLDN
ncbi:tetratricopeptide repeat protein [Fulvivirgaceae bacterium BMA12]|uniref:Tetratricopeptide repeat protein n=1 Tax=Agaribacillus aureus TaxID=3051825 RepID=A0ABT8LJR4_9BACT|nr:tetratricopeptide repeat protein [Fulvivirgaceae bacterium BMA12]